MYSKARILGHPIHPMLVAFPVAFYTSTFVAFLLYAGGHDAFWYRVAYTANWAGVVMALVAAVPGFIDWAVGIPPGTGAKSTGFLHMSLNVSALVLFLINGLVYSSRSDQLMPAPGAGLVLSAAGIALTLGAGYLGWKLVQDHHVGVHLTAEQERLEPQPPRAGLPPIDVSSGRMRPT